MKSRGIDLLVAVQEGIIDFKAWAEDSFSKTGISITNKTSKQLKIDFSRLVFLPKNDNRFQRIVLSYPAKIESEYGILILNAKEKQEFVFESYCLDRHKVPPNNGTEYFLRPESLSDFFVDFLRQHPDQTKVWEFIAKSDTLPVMPGGVPVDSPKSLYKFDKHLAQRKAINLSDLQDTIEHGKLDSHPVNRWVAEYDNTRDEAPWYFCKYDGTIFQRRDEYCPNPYHPHPAPRKISSGFLWFLLALMSLAFAYTIVNDQIFQTIVTTAALISGFIIIFLPFMFLSAAIAESATELGVFETYLSKFVSFGMAIIAMLIMWIWTGKPPDFALWFIEFTIAFLLDNLLSDRLARWIYKLSFSNRSISDGEV